MVKFHENDHFVAWLDPKTKKNQEKHEFVIPPAQFSKTLKMSKFTSPFWAFIMRISCTWEIQISKFVDFLKDHKQ